MWSLKNNTNECTLRNKLTDIENELMATKGERERDKLGEWNEEIQTTIHKIDKQQGFTIKHRELYSISCNKL